MRLGFLGPPGTFSEEAVRAGPLEDGADLVPFPSIHDAVMAVQARQVDRALVPIENSLEGGRVRDEVACPLVAEHGLLVGAQAAQAPEEQERDDERDEGDRGRGDRHDAGGGRQVLHDCERIGARPNPQLVKITV